MGESVKIDLHSKDILTDRINTLCNLFPEESVNFDTTENLSIEPGST